MIVPELIQVFVALSDSRGVFQPPLDGILVQCRVTSNIEFAGSHLHTWVES